MSGLAHKNAIMHLYRQLEDIMSVNGSVERENIVLSCVGGDFTIASQRIMKSKIKDRAEFDGIFEIHSKFELSYDKKHINLCDALEMINIHVFTRYNSQITGSQWFYMVKEFGEQFPLDKIVLPTRQDSYQPECLQKALTEILFETNDPIYKYHVNYRDGNEKYVTCESDTYYFVVFMGTS